MATKIRIFLTSCDLDRMQKLLLKECIDKLTSVVTEIMNVSVDAT